MPTDLLTPDERTLVEKVRKGIFGQRDYLDVFTTVWKMLELVDRLAPVPQIKTAFVKSDGGRAAAGYKGITGDCTCRAIAHATGLPYQTVYDGLNAQAKKQRRTKRNPNPGTARTGVSIPVIRKYMTGLGWTWHACVTIGSGCTVHLRADELPAGRLVVQLSKHMTAVLDGTIYDLYDPSRNGMRCVYGYFSKDK